MKGRKKWAVAFNSPFVRLFQMLFEHGQVPHNSGFARERRAKLLGLQAGQYCNIVTAEEQF